MRELTVFPSYLNTDSPVTCIILKASTLNTIFMLTCGAKVAVTVVPDGPTEPCSHPCEATDLLEDSK